MVPAGVEHFEIARRGSAPALRGDGAARTVPWWSSCTAFPSAGSSWRYQLPALAAAGFRAVAPDLRGYGGSDKPRGVPAYRIEELVGDVAALDCRARARAGRRRRPRLGRATVAWHLAMWNPERVRRLAILNIPHPARMRRALRTLRQLRKSWYIFFFQLPLLPERFLSPQSIRKAFRYMPARRAPSTRRTWKPSSTPPATGRRPSTTTGRRRATRARRGSR